MSWYGHLKDTVQQMLQFINFIGPSLMHSNMLRKLQELYMGIPDRTEYKDIEVVLVNFLLL